MMLHMTTDFLHLIEPGMYGTNLGEFMYQLADEYIDDFKNAIVLYGVDKINEMLSEDSIIESLGICKVENASLNSPQFYNYENDSIEFDLIIPEETIEKFRNAEYDDDFFKWSKRNYGSYDGFISFFPYERQQFEMALKTSDLDLSRAISMIIMKIFEQEFGEDEIARYQRDFEDDVIEEGNRNGWFISEVKNMRIINRSRGSSKTTMLVYTAYVTGHPIIVYTEVSKSNVIEIAKKMNILDFIDVYTLNEWLRYGNHGRHNKGVLVDNMDLMFDRILSDYLNTPVIAGTISIPMDKASMEVR